MGWNAFAQNPPAQPPPLGNIPGAQPGAGNAAAQPGPNAAATPVERSGGQPASAPPPAASGVTAGVPNLNDEVQLRLPDADLETVLSALEIYTGKIVLRPAQLITASYNIKIDRPVPKWEAILVIETVLALNKIGLAPLGDRIIKVVNLQDVKTEAPEMITGTTLDRPASGKAATKIFQLEFLRVAEFLPMIQSSILNPFYGQPVILQNANAMMITDSLSNLQRVELLLQQLDKPVTAGMKPMFYQLKNGAKASDVVNKLRTILTGTLMNQLGSATSYSFDDRTNKIVIVTDPRQWDFFTDLIDQLDQKSDPNTRTEVLYLKHAKAEDVATLLIRIIQGQTTAARQTGTTSVRPGQLGQPGGQPPTPGAPQPPPQPQMVSGSAGNNPNLDAGGGNEFSALMTVVNDNRSNAVVVFGTSDDIRLARDLVEKLDIVLAQVRIEVVIAEVTLDDNHQSGISALGLKIDGDKLVGFSGAYGTALSIANGTITRPGSTGHMDLAAEISIGTTPRKTNSAIISTPAIVTSHGKKSFISTGEKRPIITGTISSATGVSSGLAQQSQTTLTPITTRIEVTPFIGIDGSVQLDIKQTVEDVTGEVIINNESQPLIGTRETESYVTAKSGQIIVLGGFQKKIDLKTTSRLGPIPIIGDIFGARRKDNYRQELIFFLRPTVLTNEPAIDNAEAMRRVERLPTRDLIKEQLDPTHKVPPQSVLDRILPK